MSSKIILIKAIAEEYGLDNANLRRYLKKHNLAADFTKIRCRERHNQLCSGVSWPVARQIYKQLNRDGYSRQIGGEKI